MKSKLLLWIAFTIKVASFITGLSALPTIALLPPEWMAYATFIFAAASILKDFSNRLGDLLDDGKLNGSWKHGVSLILAACLPLTAISCATDTMSNRQIAIAQASVEVARIGVTLAEVEFAKKLSDPKTPTWQTLAAQQAVYQARKALDREEKRLQAALEARALPAATSAKIPETITP